ncbi:MFS transporter, ACS family, allantoate permease, partial [Tremellales sp. Uapishka_1]
MADEKEDVNILEAQGDSLDRSNDKALALLAAEGGRVFDPEGPEARAVKRKIDLHILPLLVITVLLQNMDKATLSYGSIMGLKTDTHLTADEYSWLGSLVYFGFLAWEIPTHILIQKLPLARYASITVILHVAVLAGWRHVVSSSASLVNRIAFWFGTGAVAQVTGGALAYGVYSIKHPSLHTWQIYFLILGLLTVCHGILLVFGLGASPTQASWLSEDEKIIALERLRTGKTGTETHRFKKSQMIEAFQDVRLYLFFLIMVCTGLPNGGVGAFGPAIIKAFGFNTGETTLLSMAPGVSEAIGVVVGCLLAKTTRSRCWSGVACIAVAVIGVIMMLAIPTEQKYARYAGYCLLYWWPVCVIFVLSWLSSCVSGTTKKVMFNLAYNLGYCVGNILGPQTFRASDAPNYPIAKGVMLAFIIMSGVFLILIWGVHLIWNKRRDRQDAADKAAGIVYEVPLNVEFLDLTDKEQRAFRYPL